MRSLTRDGILIDILFIWSSRGLLCFLVIYVYERIHFNFKFETCHNRY